MKKIKELLILIVILLLFTTNCNATENTENNKDTRVCDYHDIYLDINYMSPMYSVEELKNIFAALPYGKNEQCIPYNKEIKCLYQMYI